MFNSAAVKVEISSRDQTEDEKTIRFSQDFSSEILGSKKDRDFVLWIWCKSLKLKEMNESKHLRYTFDHLSEENARFVDGTGVNMDSDQLKKVAVGKCCCPSALYTHLEEHK